MSVVEHESWMKSEQIEDIIKEFQTIKISTPRQPPLPVVPKQIQLDDDEIIDLLVKVWIVENWISTGEGVLLCSNRYSFRNSILLNLFLFAVHCMNKNETVQSTRRDHTTEQNASMFSTLYC